MRFACAYKAGLGLPGGKVHLADGETVDLDAETVAIPAVAAWIEAGWLVPEKPAKK